MPQLLAQSLALSTVQETFNTPNPSPSLLPPRSHSVLLDSCLVAQGGEDQSGVGGTEHQSASHQVWNSTRLAAGLPQRPGLESAEGAGPCPLCLQGRGLADEMPTGQK